MKTRTFIALALIISSFSLCSCGTYMSSKSAILKIEKGMSKKEVVGLLGEPNFRRFDEQVEQWEYKKEGLLSSETTIIIVDFINGRVSNMNSFNGDSYPNPPVAVYPSDPIDYETSPYPSHPKGHGRPFKAVSEGDFQQLYSKIKQKPFKDDQLELLEMGVNNRYFTCKQCIRLMSIYSFDDEKLKVLEIVAPHIIDMENHEDIIKSLSFISSEEKAHKILRQARK